MINVKGLTKNFEHMEVLKGIDETIEKGEKVVLDEIPLVADKYAELRWRDACIQD